MTETILLKYASRSRPGRFTEGMRSLAKLTSDKKHLNILCILDRDDPDAKVYFDACNQYAAEFNDVWISYGHSRSKIHAINRSIPLEMDWDIVVNFSDDMCMTTYGWDQLIRDGFRCHGGDLFLHYPDSTAKQMLPTMSVMDRAYFERDGFIYQPSYESVFADNEAMEVAQRRGRYRYIPTQIFDHFHPAYGMAEWDEQYRRQQAQPVWNRDEANYTNRKENNFFLDATLKYIDTNRYRTTAPT